MFHINVDFSELEQFTDRLPDAAEKAMDTAVQQLTAATYGHILEKVQQSLHSRREKYLESLHMKEVDGVWMITLDASARWIEDGMPEHEMLDDLLKSPKAKTAKDGSKYIVVPFRHGPGLGPTNSTPAQQDLTSTIKAAFKKAGIPFGTIERGENGKPMLGKLHTFNIMNQPKKTREGPGQGRGSIGDVKQGWTGTPFLQGISVYQRMTNDKQGKPHVQRSIMTFRVASSKQKGTGKWVHPGLEPKNFLDEGAEWALKEWEDKIAPMVLDYVIQWV